MPIDVPSIRGKVDYDVERVIRDLAAGVNRLEGSESGQALQSLRQQIEALTRQVALDAQRLDDLIRRVAALENP